VPRIYVKKGELRRSEAITSLFTKDEKQRVTEIAQAHGLPPAVFVRSIVIKSLQEQAA